MGAERGFGREREAGQHGTHVCMHVFMYVDARMCMCVCVCGVHGLEFRV